MSVRLLAIILLCCGLFESNATAAQFGLHLASVHAPRNGMNNANPGAYIISDKGWTIGAYYNSERRVSAYAGRTLIYNLPHDWRVEIALGGVSGYGKRRLLPVLAPSVSTPAVDGWRVRVAYLPKVEKNGTNVLHLMVQREL